MSMKMIAGRIWAATLAFGFPLLVVVSLLWNRPDVADEMNWVEAIFAGVILATWAALAWNALKDRAE